MHPWIFVLALLSSTLWYSCQVAPTTTDSTNTPMSTPKKVLFVLTSHDQKGDTGAPTGFYLSEASHPWKVLTEAGYTVDFVSPKGGPAPVDGLDLTDATNQAFWDNPSIRQQLEQTLTPDAINPADYVAIHYVGGHGTMWDFPDNEALAQIAATIYEQGGAISAVCHGPAGLVNIRLSNGQYLVAGKRVNAFTNAEEAAVELTDVVPFLLEDLLQERGAQFEHSGLWEPHVTVDGRLITGQNPASATGVGQALVEVLAQVPVQ